MPTYLRLPPFVEPFQVLEHKGVLKEYMSEVMQVAQFRVVSLHLQTRRSHTVLWGSRLSAIELGRVEGYGGIAAQGHE